MRTATIALCGVLSLAAIARAQKASPAAPRPVPAPRARTNVNVDVPGLPGPPGPRLKLTETFAIDGAREKFKSDISVNLGPGGLTVVRAGYQSLSAYDSMGHRRWSMDVSRNGEIGDISAIGWRGAEMWISDRRFDQVALVDHGTVTKSLELPSWVRPAWSNRSTFPVFGRMDVRALLADGSMILLPGRPHSVVGTVGYDSTMQYVLHVTESGIIKNSIAKFPSLDHAFRSASVRADRERTDAVVLPNSWTFSSDYWPRVRVAPDGMRTVVVSVDTSHAATDTISVVSVNESGGPVFTRKFGVPRISFTEKQIDSIASERFGGPDAEYRERRAKGLPRTVASVRDVILGRDYSVWITLRDAGGAKAVVGIDPTGQVIGTAYIPAIFWVKAADRGLLWIVDYRPTYRDVVRYSVARK